jgi:hypothetical protein
MDPADGWGTDFDDAAMRALNVSADALGLVVVKMGDGLWILTDPLRVTRESFATLDDLQAQISFLQAQQAAS